MDDRAYLRVRPLVLISVLFGPLLISAAVFAREPNYCDRRVLAEVGRSSLAVRTAYQPRPDLDHPDRCEGTYGLKHAARADIRALWGTCGDVLPTETPDRLSLSWRRPGGAAGRVHVSVRSFSTAARPALPYLLDAEPEHGAAFVWGADVVRALRLQVASLGPTLKVDEGDSPESNFIPAFWGDRPPGPCAGRYILAIGLNRLADPPRSVIVYRRDAADGWVRILAATAAYDGEIGFIDIPWTALDRGDRRYQLKIVISPTPLSAIDVSASADAGAAGRYLPITLGLEHVERR